MSANELNRLGNWSIKPANIQLVNQLITSSKAASRFPGAKLNHIEGENQWTNKAMLINQLATDNQKQTGRHTKSGGIS